MAYRFPNRWCTKPPNKNLHRKNLRNSTLRPKFRFSHFIPSSSPKQWWNRLLRPYLRQSWIRCSINLAKIISQWKKTNPVYTSCMCVPYHETSKTGAYSNASKYNWKNFCITAKTTMYQATWIFGRTRNSSFWFLRRDHPGEKNRKPTWY